MVHFYSFVKNAGLCKKAYTPENPSYRTQVFYFSLCQSQQRSRSNYTAKQGQIALVHRIVEALKHSYSRGKVKKSHSAFLCLLS